MIYLVIADIQSIEKDCRVSRQSCNLFSKEIKDYIENTKNDQTRTERFIAYSSLFYSLKEFYSVNNAKLVKNENGKPSIVDSDIQISLSHCDGVCTIVFSDEGEIGVDIQSPLDEAKAERLNARFLSEIQPKQEEIEIKCFYMTFSDNGAEFTEITLKNSPNEDFLSKWVYTESVIKAFGLTFSDISKINELSKNTKTAIFNYKKFKIAITEIV